MQKITLLINKHPQLILIVDHKKKHTATTFSDGSAANMILPENERTYKGLERRLTYYTNNKKDLKEQLIDYQNNGFVADMQINLKLEIEDLA